MVGDLMGARRRGEREGSGGGAAAQGRKREWGRGKGVASALIWPDARLLLALNSLVLSFDRTDAGVLRWGEKVAVKSPLGLTGCVDDGLRGEDILASSGAQLAGIDCVEATPPSLWRPDHSSFFPFFD